MRISRPLLGRNPGGHSASAGLLTRTDSFVAPAHSYCRVGGSIHILRCSCLIGCGSGKGMMYETWCESFWLNIVMASVMSYVQACAIRRSAERFQ